MERVQDPVTQWCVLIEETVGMGEGQRWSVSRIRKFDTREDALAAAEQTAREYQPQHPTFAKARDVYQIGVDSWVVCVPGATRQYHFRVSVGKKV
ncbi:hypothetical protein LWC34_37375 [Kibdelosporangium philippinense]|uniref:Uncharacterized protein n=1 Tax=Kibdelosporangium philippinense TaxID=211113 RepID=A0ABS8ZKW8_9PSEU|nr:hypothetical protein [Kibdelosporangium philippinense]MCE7008446.1 hypothetical protein [Kibdelosporangium philippinense]